MSPIFLSLYLSYMRSTTVIYDEATSDPLYQSNDTVNTQTGEGSNERSPAVECMCPRTSFDNSISEFELSVGYMAVGSICLALKGLYGLVVGSLVCVAG